MKLAKSAFIVTVLAFAATRPALANLVTSSAGITGATVVNMPVVNYFGPGPQTVAPGITWDSTNASNQSGSVFGYNEGYGFSSNGFWDSNVGAIAGVNDSFDAYGVSDTMTFDFATAVSGVGGFMNYVPGGSTATTIAVYDTSDNLIESYDLSFLTGGGTDTGQFLGFQEATADIGSFTLSDNYIAISGLTVSSSSVPDDASTALLLGLGSIALMVAAKKRSKRA